MTLDINIISIIYLAKIKCTLFLFIPEIKPVQFKPVTKVNLDEVSV